MNNQSKFIIRKLPAFTLPELIVGMLLMLVLFGFVSAVYAIFSRQSGLQFETNRLLMEYRATKHILQRDFERASCIYFDPGSNTFILTQRSSSPTITYRFDDSYILRNQHEHTDTLKPGMMVAAKTFADDSLSMISSIDLQHTYRMQVCYISLEKKYAWADIINYQHSKLP